MGAERGSVEIVGGDAALQANLDGLLGDIGEGGEGAEVGEVFDEALGEVIDGEGGDVGPGEEADEFGGEEEHGGTPGKCKVQMQVQIGIRGGLGGCGAERDTPPPSLLPAQHLPAGAGEERQVSGAEEVESL